jgi:hypothetical protein
MVKVFEGTNKEYYMDGYLKNTLDTAKTVIKKDWDMVIIIDGSEGSGKSVKAMQMAYYCDHTLILDRIVFNPRDFRKAIMKAEKYQSIVYDEAYTGLSSRSAMTLINRTLVSMLAEIRQKNLFVFVVMPCIFDLDRYVSLWRSRALVHVYTGDNFERGYLAFYNVDRKKSLIMVGKKFYSYSNPKPNFIGRFTAAYVVDEDKYKEKKLKSLLVREKTAEEEQIRKEVDENLFIRFIELGNEIPTKLKLKILNIPAATYYERVRKYKKMEELNKLL